MSLTTAPRASGSGRFAELAARVTTLRGAERDELEIENPTVGRPLGTVPRCSAEDVELAATRARAAQVGWAQTSFSARAATLMRLHDLVLERQDEVLDVIQLESGKARRHAFEEILDVALVARYYARSAEHLLRTRAEVLGVHGQQPVEPLDEDDPRRGGVDAAEVPGEHPVRHLAQ